MPDFISGLIIGTLAGFVLASLFFVFVVLVRIKQIQKEKEEE